MTSPCSNTSTIRPAVFAWERRLIMASNERDVPCEHSFNTLPLSQQYGILTESFSDLFNNLCRTRLRVKGFLTNNASAAHPFRIKWRLSITEECPNLEPVNRCWQLSWVWIASAGPHLFVLACILGVVFPCRLCPVGCRARQRLPRPLLYQSWTCEARARYVQS
jgi:hypothetical protein